MTRFLFALATGFVLFSSPLQAGWFSRGIGSAMQYGPYTGGHGYSYNVAYSYGFPFSAADTWQRDLLAYPQGIYPYRPYGKPIYHRVFPKPDTPYISVPGPNGLPTLIRPGAIADPFPTHPWLNYTPMITSLKPAEMPSLQPVPADSEVARSGVVRIVVPAGAEVWVEKEKMDQTGSQRAFQSPPLAPGQMRIYSVKARWYEDGKEIEQYRVVGVKAGETARLKFGATNP